MKRYKLTIEYDGTCFSGFQRQRNAFSVQELIEKSLLNIVREPVIIFGAGRTDSGVHAKGQVIHFDLSKDIEPSKIQTGLNYFMKNKGCFVTDSVIVDDTFHARFSAIERSYQYIILNRLPPSVFEVGRSWHVKKPLNIEKMQEAANYFLGTHDFKAFRHSDCQSKITIKTMNSCSIEQAEDKIIINLSSKSFLHNQVRIMVGTLVDIGLLKMKPIIIKELLENGIRQKAGITAPPDGLYFMNVKYY